MKTLELGFLILFFLFVWKCMLKPAFRDLVRDKLFDCREELRSHFLQHEKLGLESPAYCYLRNSINYRIRHIDDISLISASVVCNYVQANESLSREIERRAQNETAALNMNPQVSNYYLSKTSRWVTFYWVHSSMITALSFYSTVFTAIMFFALKRKASNLKAVYTQQLDKTFDENKMKLLAFSNDIPQIC